MFDWQPTLVDGDLILRPLKSDDFEGLKDAASDAKTWAGHPAKDRWKPEVFEKYFEYLLGTGTCLVFVYTGKIIGCSRFYPVPNEPDDVGIGYTFLNHEYWGGDMNWRVKTAMFAHAFQTLPRVMFHIDPGNIRSQKATAKLGARHVYEADLDLGTGMAPWKVYEVLAADWAVLKGSKQ